MNVLESFWMYASLNQTVVLNLCEMDLFQRMIWLIPKDYVGKCIFYWSFSFNRLVLWWNKIYFFKRKNVIMSQVQQSFIFWNKCTFRQIKKHYYLTKKQRRIIIQFEVSSVILCVFWSKTWMCLIYVPIYFIFGETMTNTLSGYTTSNWIYP